MSRIHEALKKAQEERASQQPDRSTNVQQTAEAAPAPVSIAAPAALLEAPELSAAPAAPVAQHEPGALTFESVLARSRQRRWNPDPGMLLFTNGDNEDSMGKEVFRTLRTRLYQ